MNELIKKEPFAMFDINIVGQIAQKRRIRTYIKSVLSYLSPRLRRPVSITVEVSTNLENNHYALCWGDKNEIIIELARQSGDTKFTLDDMMLNLAHELVHAKQFLTGQLSPVRQNWKSKNYSTTPYSRQPWEREAYAKEDKLYSIFWE
jgi:hypothetical protein